jgi:hypothetical protein
MAHHAKLDGGRDPGGDAPDAPEPLGHRVEASAETISRGTAAVSTIAGGAALGAALGPEGAVVGALVGAAIAAPYWRTRRSKHHTVSK